VRENESRGRLGRGLSLKNNDLLCSKATIGCVISLILRTFQGSDFIEGFGIERTVQPNQRRNSTISMRVPGAASVHRSERPSSRREHRDGAFLNLVIYGMAGLEHRSSEVGTPQSLPRSRFSHLATRIAPSDLRWPQARPIATRPIATRPARRSNALSARASYQSCKSRKPKTRRPETEPETINRLDRQSTTSTKDWACRP